MSVHLRHLNADSTFLLTFSLPNPAGEPSTDGVFTVLTDPWLAESGAPQIHPKFAYAARKVPAHVSHLSQIPPPDVVIISQDKPDHCHEDTLRQLPAELPKTTILAHPDAAKKIRSWKYFNPSKVHSLRTYSGKDYGTVVRFTVPVRIPGASPGEATIVLIKQPRDLTKLHNAVAITYRPPMGVIAPSAVQRSESGHSRAQSSSGAPESTGNGGVQLRTMLSSPALQQHDAQYAPQMHPQIPITPPDTPPESEQDPSEVVLSPATNFSLPFGSQRQRSRTLSSLITPPESMTSRSDSSVSDSFPGLTVSASSTSLQNTSYPPPTSPPTIPLPPIPDVASSDQQQQQQQPSIDSIAAHAQPGSMLARPATSGRGRSVSSASAAHSPKTVSVLYAPHGIDFAAVRAYAQTHLVHCAALPLTLLLHPFARVDNPWYLGGNISAGVPGALEIVRRLMVRNWVSAHDEDKEESGVGIKMIRKGLWSERQVRGLLGGGGIGGGGCGGSVCDARDLGCGEEAVMTA